MPIVARNNRSEVEQVNQIDMDINEVVKEYMKEGKSTLDGNQSVLVNAYIVCALKNDTLGYNEVMELTELFEQILNKL